MYFDRPMNRLVVDHECDRRTDGQTNILVANAAHYYVAGPKTSFIDSVHQGFIK